MPIDHVKLPMSDVEDSRAFYSAALAPFGYTLVYDGETSLGFGTGDGGDDNEPFALELVRSRARTSRSRPPRPSRSTP